MFSKPLILNKLLQVNVDEEEEEKILKEVRVHAAVNAPGNGVKVPSWALTEKFTSSENAEPTRMLSLCAAGGVAE